MSDALKTVFDAARKWRDELHENIIPPASNEDAKGYEEESKAISEALDQLQPIIIYFTGTNEAPDRFGLAYDSEEDALESARENELQVWRVPVIPNWDAAEFVTPDGEGEEDAEEAEEQDGGGYPRSQLLPLRLYFCAPSEDYFYTPDGIGLVWFESKAQAIREVGQFGKPILTLHEHPADY